MAIDKKPIQDMPVKHFGDKHFSSEFNTVRKSLLDIIDGVNALPEMIESDFKGIIAPSDPTPTEDGTYKPSVYSADPGTNYPNAGNLKARNGYSTLFYKKGTVWTLSETPLPSTAVVDGFASSSTTDASSAKNAKVLNDIIVSNFVPKYSYTEFYDPATALNGYYNATGVFTANADWKATPKIDVVAGEIWRYRGKPYTSLAIRGVYGFKADNSIVILVGVINAIDFVEFTIPADVVKIAASYNISTGTNFNLQKVIATMVLVSITKDSVGNVTTINNENIYKIFTGLSIASVGDSITANGVGGSLKGYQLCLQDLYNFTTYTTYGYSGRALSTFLTPDGNSIIEQFINNAVSKDIFTLLAGTNDFKLDIRAGEIGTLNDYKNLTSYGAVGSVISLNFYQALKAFVLRCYELNPKAKIIFMTPLQRNNGGYTSWSTNGVGRTLSDFVNAIREVAAYESIPVVDFFKEGVINMRNLTQYTSDGLHPNNDGYKIMSKLIAKRLDYVI